MASLRLRDTVGGRHHLVRAGSQPTAWKYREERSECQRRKSVDAARLLRRLQETTVESRGDSCAGTVHPRDRNVVAPGKTFKPWFPSVLAMKATGNSSTISPTGCIFPWLSTPSRRSLSVELLPFPQDPMEPSSKRLCHQTEKRIA